MKRAVHFIVLLLLTGVADSQGIAKKLADAVQNIEADSQMKSALIGLYVVDQKSGAAIFGKNAKTGFAVASTQKVITSAAALELLGKDYRYKTELVYDGRIESGILQGNIYITGYGDPTLGSWRYDNTKEQIVLKSWIKALKSAGIKEVAGTVVGNDKNWESQTIPGGWIWDDIGNYYGAGISALNWRENQYDLNLKPGNKTSDAVTIISTVPKLYNANLISEVTTGKPGSGDNGYIYLPPYSNNGFVRGTIPPGQSSFTISGSFPNPALQLASVFTDELIRQGIIIDSMNAETLNSLRGPKNVSFYMELSPPLDSINYWFLRKSVNLYGEALVKTLGYEKMNKGSTEAGLTVIKNFWKSNGIEPTSVNISDGSGLSPQNRITPEALVKVMQYARSKPWFSSFYNALPEFNGIKMKSGTIGGVKSFTGYVSGYTFAVIVNNFNGSPGEMVKKLYRVLDVLKQE